MIFIRLASELKNKSQVSKDDAARGIQSLGGILCTCGTRWRLAVGPEMKPDDIWIGMNFASSSLVQTLVENAGPREVDGLSMILRWSLMEIYYSPKIVNVSIKCRRCVLFQPLEPLRNDEEIPSSTVIWKFQ